MYTDNEEYTNMRLQNTVVRDRKKGILVFVLRIGEGADGLWAVVCKVNAKEEEGEINEYKLFLKDLDLSSPPLGNIDYNGDTYFVSRVPKRNDWRQGIRKDNLAYVYRGRIHKYNIPSMKVLEAPVYNVYKPYKKGRAFSRNFSVDEEGYLWYKCREIVGTDINGIPTLEKKNEWLKEALEDALER